MTGGWVRVLASAEQVRKERAGMKLAAKAGLVRSTAPTEACCWWSCSAFPGAEQTPQGSSRQRPSFSVPRLCRGVHRPAAAALRTLARGHVLGGWPGLWPAAAVARLLLAGSWPGFGPVWPRAAARAFTPSGSYLPGVAIGSGLALGRSAPYAKPLQHSRC